MDEIKILPKYIKDKLLTVVLNAQKNKELMDEVEGYLTKKGFDVDQLRDGCGCSLEEFEYGSYPIEAFCERLVSIKNGADIYNVYEEED